MGLCIHIPSESQRTNKSPLIINKFKGNEWRNNKIASIVCKRIFFLPPLSFKFLFYYRLILYLTAPCASQPFLSAHIYGISINVNILRRLCVARGQCGWKLDVEINILAALLVFISLPGIQPDYGVVGIMVFYKVCQNNAYISLLFQGINRSIFKKSSYLQQRNE